MILITGANGNLGRRLIGVLTDRDMEVKAVVRSEHAAGQIRAQHPNVSIHVLDYLDETAMVDAAAGCSHVVHLVGIIKETRNSRYIDAHEGTTEVLARVAARVCVGRIVYLSILGSQPNSSNACLASKGRAEQILLEGAAPALVLRVPMVLGEGDYASAALKARANKSVNVLFRGGSLEQPVYAGDVVEAIAACAGNSEAGSGDTQDTQNLQIDLAGPTSLSRSALTRQAARSQGRETKIVSLPVWLGMAGVWLLEKFLANPPVTRVMLDVLDHDDDIDPLPGARLLGIQLTDLNTMLERCVSH